MNNTRVVLSVEPRLQAELLKRTLLGCLGFEIVGESATVVDSLRLIASERPDLWIHSWEEGPKTTAALSHIYTFHPELAVMRVSPKEAAGYLQLRVHSVAELADMARRSVCLPTSGAPDRRSLWDSKDHEDSNNSLLRMSQAHE